MRVSLSRSEAVVRDLLARAETFTVTAGGHVESRLLPERDQAYGEWVVGTRTAEDWFRVMMDSTCLIGRGRGIDLLVDGEPVYLRANQVRLFLQPTVLRPAARDDRDLAPVVTEMLADFLELHEDDLDGEAVFAAVYLLETGRTYAAWVVEDRFELPPDARGRRRFETHRRLEISDRPFAEMGAGARATPCFETMSY